jgi:hypothetical protein
MERRNRYATAILQRRNRYAFTLFPAPFLMILPYPLVQSLYLNSCSLPLAYW